MKARLLHFIVPAMLATVTLSLKSFSQCPDCNNADPFGFISSVCSLQTLNVQLSSPPTVCIATTPTCAVGVQHTYNISFSTPVRAFYIDFPGGYILQRTVNGVVSTYDPCSHASFTDQVNFDINSNNISSVTVTLRWPTQGPNRIKVYGYIRQDNSSGFPNQIISYGCNETTFTWQTPPVAPANIFLSSPKCYPPGWLLGNQSSPGAYSYTWSGAVLATCYTVIGPFVSANQTINVCVTANNSCGQSPATCSTLVIPRVSWCGGGWFRNQEPAGKIIYENDKETSSNMDAYPNPASNFISLYIKKSGRYISNITTVSGKIILSQIIQGQIKTDIDVSKLVKGIYIIVIKENAFIVERKKILIQ
jgi:Secretion system C-terminal sorting domain